MRNIWMLALVISISSWSQAVEPSAGRLDHSPTVVGKQGSIQQMRGGKSGTVEGLLSAVPSRIIGASCSGPGGTATLKMTSNRFHVGQWIAVRDVPPSGPIAVTSEKVGVGDGSRTTFTFRTANYPIQRGSVTVLVGGMSQGVDEPGVPFPGVGRLHGSGIGTFRGTVTISGGSDVTLTSTPAVFDSRWQAYLPTIAGQRGRYIVGSGVDSTHLKLMAPAPDGAGQSFTLSSQVNYLTGVIEVTFVSAPGAGVPITINYTTEPSRWHGERKVESVTAHTVSYAEPSCTSARAKASGGTAYALPVIYVAPASHTTCTYDGDGGQACKPSDANPGISKARPKATLEGVKQAINRHILTVPYMIQLADANGTGLGGSTPGTDCYQPDVVTFSVLTMGGSPVDDNEQLWVNRYPQSYLWFHGNSKNPANVLFNGSGSCAKASETIVTSEALHFDHTAARVDGFRAQGYGNRMHRGLGPSTIAFGNFSTGYVENMICMGPPDHEPSSTVTCAGAWDHSTLKVGANHKVRNANWVVAVNGSNLFTATPADGPTQNTNLDYYSDAHTLAIACSILSNCQVDHLTANYKGSGNYIAQAATEKSIFFYAERYVGSMCPNAACMNITIDAPNMIWESSQLGGHIDGTCGNHQQGVCTVISGPAIRSYSEEDSFVKEYSQSEIKKAPDIQVGGGCLEVWNAGWEKIPGRQPPTCSAYAFKSESKSFGPLGIQNASGSNTNLVDLKTGSGALAASFNSAGQVSRINGVATAGNGLGAEVYSTVSAVANRSLPATTMLTPKTDGSFAVHFYVTQVDSGKDCAAGARVAVNLIYTDPFSGASQPLTYIVPLQSSGRASAASTLSLSTDTITGANVATGSMVFRARGSTPIQYSTTYSVGKCTRQPRYRVLPLLIWF